MEKFELVLAKLSDDNTSGSEELLSRALDYLRAIVEDPELEGEKFEKALSRLPETIQDNFAEIAPLATLAERIREISGDNLKGKVAEIEEELRGKRSEQVKSIASIGESLIGENVTVSTISRSGTVLELLARARAAGRDFHVIASVGEPAREGLLMAKDLAEKGIEVTLVPDSAAGFAAAHSGIVFVGADAVTPEFFVNKIGTLPLALAASHSGVPFYVCSRLAKFYPREKLPSAVKVISARELGASDAELISSGAPLFERIPNSLVTGIVTEGGIVKPERGKIEVYEEDR